jgi:hypothetical protein
MAGASIRRWPMPHHPGIELPHRSREPRWRRRPDAGSAGHGRRYGGRAAPRQRSVAQGPAGQHRLWPGVHRADPRKRAPAASCPR